MTTSTPLKTLRSAGPGCAAERPQQRSLYPDACRLNIFDHMHGLRVHDPYRWLEDGEDPQTKAWSSEQDDLLAAHRRTWPLRELFRAQLAALLAIGDVSTPACRGNRKFFYRREAGHEHRAFLAIDSGDTERMLIDPMAIDPTGRTVIDFAEPCIEGRLVAYGLSVNGTEDSELYVLDVDTGKIIDGPIDRSRYTDIAWLPGGEAFYYVRHLPLDAVPGGEGYLHRRVYLHRVSAELTTDVLIAGADAAPGRYFHITVSADGRWLTLIDRQGTDPRDNVRVADLTGGSIEEPAFTVVQREDVDARTTVHHRGGRAYIWTNRDAPRGRLCVATPGRLAYPDWCDLVPEDPEAVLTDYAVLDATHLPRPLLLVSRTRHAISELAVHDLATGEPMSTVALPGLGSLTGLRTTSANSGEAWFSYSDFANPWAVYRFDAADGSVTPSARPSGDRAPLPLEVRQVTYPSGDGTEVRMFVIADEHAPAGPGPTILYGYGGFNTPINPSWWATIAAWVSAGGVFAMASLRGGSDEGERWHRAGMLNCKQNVFDDFRAAAEWLIGRDVTTPEQLCVMGGSNGGLLVGAALTQFPELFAGAVCGAPLLDMLRYELFGLGMTWTGEYGTVADPEQFGWLRAYSPYHNVHEGIDYPAVLFTVFDGDTRIDPLHAHKMAAALQYATSGTRPILVRREKDVGHGQRAVTRTVELSADELAFAAAATGLHATGGSRASSSN
ncbi:prolyl endopeptidase [Catellatospora sp. TT07R-123]|uniref:prolyl oligopeptidase family serine peptidase n=1 Tax=Catellatospora sp. TT07R-123 TaxID=2733863 RepID=UPI001B013758|nr:prolyl oligopeptidase family serine peptidase [Catellatospora sp. TT07R-123]GHJ43285.1 prolyl endopeptidase [Catellatospora sp. TT07R-123]